MWCGGLCGLGRDGVGWVGREGRMCRMVCGGVGMPGAGKMPVCTSVVVFYSG